MSYIQLHSDGVVYIKDADDTVLYGDREDKFAEDAGKAAPSLPPGMVSMTYDPDTKIKVFYDRKQNAYPVEGQVDDDELTALVADQPALIAAQSARVAAEKQAAIDAQAALDAEKQAALDDAKALG